MNFEQLIMQYQDSDLEKKKELISEFLLQQEENNFYDFLINIFFDYHKPHLQDYAIDILSQDPDKAFSAAKYLLHTIKEEDELDSLKYYGAMVIKEMGNKFDYKITIPMLVSAYNTEDYRDTRWSIAMALSGLINEPVKLITKAIDSNIEVKEELFLHLRSYTTIDFDIKYEIYNEQESE